MLKVWGFNDPYTGGLSSYALFLLIVSFLQAKQISTDLHQVNIGHVLLEFLKYYSELDVKKYASACSEPGHINQRLNIYPCDDEVSATEFASSYMQFTNAYNQHIFIDDPLNMNNNVGKSAFRYQHIRVSLQSTLISLEHFQSDLQHGFPRLLLPLRNDLPERQHFPPKPARVHQPE